MLVFYTRFIAFCSVFLILPSLCMKPGYIDDKTWDEYRRSWTSTAPLSCTHVAIAERLAKTRATVARSRGSTSEWNNFAAFGLSVVGVDGKSVSEIFPRLLFSAYNVPEHIPVVDILGEALIAIPDMFRGDMMHRATQSEKVLEFFCWLASNSYTNKWDMHQLIADQSALVASKDAAKMAILPGGSELSQSLLHCEQVLLYMMLKDDSLIRDLVSRLITQNEAFASLTSKDSIITLDILTYNDMCPKCFSTCYHLQKTLETSINRILFEEIKKRGKLLDFSKRGAFPVNVQIQVSSFRPFLIIGDLMTRGTKGSYNYVEYSALKSPMSCVYSRDLPVVQIFNPLIAQHILSYQIDDFIASVEGLGIGKFTDTWKLWEKFSVLSKDMEQEVKNKIAAKLVSKRAIFTKSEVCCSILGFLIDLACQISEHRDAHYSLVRDLAANAMIDNKQLPQLIEHLRTIPGSPAHITAAINDQQMLVNTYDFLNKSIPDKGRYNFVAMTATAERIILTNVHPIISSFITLKANEIYGKIKHIRLSARLKNALRGLGVTL